MLTKALRIYGKEDLRLEEFELPEMKDDEIVAKVINSFIVSFVINILLLNKSIIPVLNIPVIKIIISTINWDIVYPAKPNITENNSLLLFFLCPNIIPRNPLCITLNISKNRTASIPIMNSVVLTFNPVDKLFINSFTIIHLSSV